MKKTIWSLALILSTAGLFGGESLRPAKTPSLGDWTVFGASQPALSEAAEFSLPAGGQLARTISADRVIVELRAQPIFGVAAEDLVTLEVGPAALSFARDGEVGKLALVLGDSRPVVLPCSFTLTENGTTAEPVRVQLTFERGSGVVTVATDRQALLYRTKASTTPVDVVLSAGSHDAVPVQELTVHLETSDDAAVSLDESATAGGGDESAVLVAGGKPKAVQIIAGANGDIAVTAAIAARRSSPDGVGPSLEIFTPPSVRIGRLDTVRAAVAAIQK